MRALILSANTGKGHNSTARAIAEQMEKFGIEYEISDALAMISEKTSEFISRGHSTVYRHFPKLFGLVYRYEERHPPRFIYEQCAKGADALAERLDAGKYDVIICVHVFSAMMLTEVRKRGRSNTPAYFVATDFTASPGVSELGMDGFFIPHRLLHHEFIRCLIPADRMYATGIPVRSAFFDKLDKLEARRALNLPEKGSMVLVGGGSMGCGKLEKSVGVLTRYLPDDAFLVMLCGENQKLYEQLNRSANDRMYIVDYTDRIPEYMSATDLYITKPGGLTTSESLAKRVPMLLIDLVPGCESRNFEFLTKNGIATGATGWKSAAKKVAELLRDGKALEEQLKRMEEYDPKNAAEEICRHLLKH